jgi:hypothetical protein
VLDASSSTSPFRGSSSKVIRSRASFNHDAI